MQGLVSILPTQDEIYSQHVESMCQLITSACGNMLHVNNYILYIM